MTESPGLRARNFVDARPGHTLSVGVAVVQKMHTIRFGESFLMIRSDAVVTKRIERQPAVGAHKKGHPAATGAQQKELGIMTEKATEASEK